jgi:hypothetical protein
LDEGSSFSRPLGKVIHDQFEARRQPDISKDWQWKVVQPVVTL